MEMDTTSLFMITVDTNAIIIITFSLIMCWHKNRRYVAKNSTKI